MVKININANLKPLQAAFKDFKKQVPFATAVALTRLAQGVVAKETEEIVKTFDSPTPFTQRSITMKAATKANLTATVYPRDIAASYLEPYVFGGNRSLGTKKGMLAPKAVGLNQYGNLTKGKMASLKGKANVFIGSVALKKGGKVSGVWQRSPAPRGQRRRHKEQAEGAAKQGGLKLLIRFEDSTPVPKRLHFFGAAEAYIDANFEKEFAAAMRKALEPRK